MKIDGKKNLNASDAELQAQHSADVISERINNHRSSGNLGDFVLGAVDGTVTTFAIVTGVAGTGISGGAMIAFVLGLANVIADGFSMGVSNYLKARSDRDTLEHFRRMEEMHIDRIPEGEKEEIRQIFSKKGFSEDILEEIVKVITKDRKLWIDTMLVEEWGLHLNPPSPVKSGIITFSAFILAGIVPLLPLLLGLSESYSNQVIFTLSAIVTGITFLVTGAFKGKVLHQNIFRSAVETLLMGGIAAALAYFVSNVFSGIIH